MGEGRLQRIKPAQPICQDPRMWSLDCSTPEMGWAEYHPVNCSLSASARETEKLTMSSLLAERGGMICKETFQGSVISTEAYMFFIY